MKIIFKENLTVTVLLLLGIASGNLYSNTGYPGRAIDKIAVKKQGDNVYIRSWFSSAQDVVITMNKGYNRQVNFCTAAVIPAATPLARVTFARNEIFHYCHDDTPPTKIISTYIGANHGCSDARNLLIPDHGLSTKDIGKAFKDSRGDIYYPIKIVSDSSIWVLGEDKGQNGVWKFNRSIKPGPFTRVSDGRKLDVKKASLVQMTPSVRLEKQLYLADGKTPLPDNKWVICDYLDIVEEYDVVAPDALLQTIIKNAGRATDFNGKGIEALYTNKTTYQFQPLGACFIDNQLTPHRDFRAYFITPVMTMQLNKLENYATLEYYIPKTKPFKNGGINYDFNAIQDFTVPIKFSLSFKKADNNIDPDNPPNRFIQFLGQKENGKTVRKVGYMFGIVNDYGLGRSAERVKNVNEMLFIFRSYKTYPKVIGMKAGKLKPEVSLNSRGFRQYFDPQAFKKPTSVNWHREGDKIRVYIDYHQAVAKDIIKLPAAFTGKKIAVIEKSPSIELKTKGPVPAQGIEVSVSGNQAYLVLQLSN